MRFIVIFVFFISTICSHAQYQLPKVDSKSFVFANGVGEFVDVEFDCDISRAISQLDLNRMVMRSIKDAMSSLKGQKKSFVPKNLTISEDKNQTVFHIRVEYLFDDQKQTDKKGHHYFEVDHRGNFLLSRKD